MKAVCTCERQETTSSDNCDMVNNRSENESSTAVGRLSAIKLSTVINRLSNQSRHTETSRLAGDVLFFQGV